MKGNNEKNVSSAHIFTQDELVRLFVESDTEVLNALGSQSSKVVVRDAKKVAEIEAREASEGEKIYTKLGEFTETKNVASKGDMIVKNPGGEEYIIRAEDFSKMYESVPGKDCMYKKSQVSKAIELHNDDDIELVPSWGGTMKLKPNAIFIYNDSPSEKCPNGEVYGVDCEAFKQTYAFCDKGVSSVRNANLSDSLDAQTKAEVAKLAKDGLSTNGVSNNNVDANVTMPDGRNRNSGVAKG